MVLATLMVISVAIAPVAYDDLVQDFRARTRTASLTALEEWIAGHPNDSQILRANLWAGELCLQEGDLSAAEFHLKLVANSEGAWRLKGRKGLADLARQRRHFGEAIALYTEVSRSEDPALAFIGQSELQQTLIARQRFDAMLFLAVALTFLIAGQFSVAIFRDGWSACFPHHWQLKLYIPLAGVLAAAATRADTPLRNAVWVLSGVGILLVWAQAALLGNSPSRSRRIISLATSAISFSLLLYCASVYFNLTDSILYTLRMGPE